MMNLDYTHSIHGPIADCQHPNEISKQAKNTVA